MRCCFTGHRPQKLCRSESEIKSELEIAIVDAIARGYRTFITGMAYGVDIWAGEIVIRLREHNPDLHLIAAIPFADFSNRWSSEWKRHYSELLSILSLDISTKNSEGSDLKDVLPVDFDLEEEVTSEMMMKTLRDSLSKWKPWACDMFDFYLMGNERLCSSALIEKYSVSYVTVAKWKRMFGEYIKKFFERG